MELLEQAFASYLQHVENCILVQTNRKITKPMFDSLPPKSKQFVQDVMDDVTKTTGKNFFKKNGAKQFITQAEIDVIGIKLENGIQKVFLYDTAFHSDNLRYGGGNAEKITEKLIRAFLVALLFFPGSQFTVGFVAPKCSPKEKKDIETNLALAFQVLKKYNSNCFVDFRVNDDCSKAIQDLIDMEPKIQDQSDLFVRSVKLCRLTAFSTPQQPSQTIVPNKTRQRGNNKPIVLGTLNSLEQSGKLTSQVVANLMDKTFCKQTLKLRGNFCCLCPATSVSPNDSGRYYPDSLLIQGQFYRATSQWYAESLTALETWAKTL